MLVPQENNSGTFNAVPGNLGAFMQSIQAHESPANEIADPIPSDEPLPGGEAPIEFETEEELSPGGRVVPRNTGRAMAHFVDKGMAFGAGLYAHDKSERFRATSQEMDELEEAFGDFLSESGIDISPAVNLIIALAAIYIFKFNDLRLIRKENLARERREELEAHQREIDAYNKARVKTEENE